MAGARSFGLVIGPCAWTPIPCAIFAKSTFGSSIVVPMWRPCDSAIVAIGHALQVHDLLVIGAVVVHHGEQRNPVMRRRPPDAGRIQKSPSP